MSIQTVEINTPDSFAVVEIRQGPAGAGGGGSATWGGITGTLSAQTDLQTALNLKAPLASPALTGTPTAPTAATTTSTTQVATTAFVQQELAAGTAVAKNLEFLAHNGSGATIAKGSIVYINGAVGGVPRITKAQGNNDTNSARTIGVVKADIADGSDGFVIIEGELQNVSTADSIGIIGAGIQLYLSPTTPGAFTRTKPSAPNHLVYVGVVVTASTGVALDGKIIVGIQNGYELNEIHDVSITAPAAKQVIKRNAGNTLWINEAIVSADVSDATDAATPSTLVRRDASGGANFAGTVNLNTGVIVDLQFEDYQAAVGATFTYGAGADAAHRTALGSGATGDPLFTAASVKAANETLLRTTKIKTTQTDRTLSTTYTTDSDFTVPVAAGKTYRVEFALYTTATNTGASGGGFKGQFTIPSVPANLAGATSQGVGITTNPGGTIVNLAMTTAGVIGAAALSRGGAATNGTYHGFFEVTIGTTGGSLLFQWAQSSSSVDNTSVLANSSVTIIERTP